MAHGQTPESTALCGHYGLDSLFQSARHELFNRREALFGTARKAGELTLTPEVGAPGTVQHAEYVLAYDRAGKFLAHASDVLLHTVDANGEGTSSLYLSFQGRELSEQAVQSALAMANTAVHNGNYIHRTVLDADVPLPGQLEPLAIAPPTLAEVA